MKQLILCAIVVFTALPVVGAVTLSDTRNFGWDGILWESGWNSDYRDVTWTHTLDGLSNNCEIYAATLSIDACGIENVWGWDSGEQADVVSISLGGYSLGQLSDGITTFDLVDLVAVGAITPETLAKAEITFQSDSPLDYFFGDMAFLKSSTLSVNCASFSPVVVPAPGAFLLAGFGTLLVGTLRRRKAI